MSGQVTWDQAFLFLFEREMRCREGGYDRRLQAKCTILRQFILVSVPRSGRLWVFLLLLYCTELTKSTPAAWVLVNLEDQMLLQKPCGEGQRRDWCLILFPLFPISQNVNICGTFAWMIHQSNHESFEVHVTHMLLTFGEDTIICTLYDVPSGIPILLVHK